MTYEEELKRLRAEGKTYDEIKAITGASKSTINYWLADDGKKNTLQRQRNSRDEIREWIIFKKELDPCTDCGKHYRFWRMQFDHLPQFEKLFNISHYKTYTNSLSVVQDEVAKCEIVCANCHADRTHYRRNPQDNSYEYFDDELN
jgi:hypothetical protein